MKTTIFCLSLLAAFCSNAASVQDDLKRENVPKILICTGHMKLDTDIDFKNMHDIVTIIDYGSRYYIISDPSINDTTVLSPTLKYSDKDQNGTGEKGDMVYIKGLGGNKNNYYLYDRKQKSTIKFMCQKSFL
ncbi:hypothetical protein [Enterobacter sp.]|uniref:hypothetical protein n=1 Tax=Enterobacter sp. TaxID=42895 RepID=UPI00296F7B3E|nr:hypothetical protein [Enterobacter sp.]